MLRIKSMSHKSMKATISGLLAAVTISSIGCTHAGPSLGIFAVPIPVTPYLQDKKEDQFWEHERYDRVPILGPITSGGPAVALDPPSDDEIIRTLERSHHVEGGFPFLHEVQRNNVRIRKDLIADYVDPVRVYPLIGPAQLHHAHYKCTVTFSETKRIGWPVPHTLEDQEVVEVLYIDHNHLHMVGDVDTGVASNY
ncbi:MAG: hypothetical protein KDA87_12435 [Planctomycetales bacterium]|nr:hypothetical protein [Planctomycetales bacterium]